MLNRRSALFLLAGTLFTAPLLVAWRQPAASSPPAPVAPGPAAPARPVPGKFLAEGAIDLRALLPDPPAPGSPASNGEIELILAVQADAAPSTVARATAEATMTVWVIFGEILGPDFNPQNRPKTAAFIRQVEFDAKGYAVGSKKLWNRPRPSDQSAVIKTLVERPDSNSYPSGHATRAALLAELLVLLAPDKADAIRARARLIGLGRIVLGVHFPSDVAAGNALGKEIVEKMKGDPEFEQDLAEARSEWTR